MRNFFVIFLFFSCASSFQKDYPRRTLVKSPNREIYTKTVLFKINNFIMALEKTALSESSEEFREQKKIAFNALKDEIDNISSLKFIGDSGNKADLYIHFDVDRQFSSNQFWKYFTPFTLYLLPRRTEEKVRLSVRYYDGNLNMIGMTEHDDFLIRWMHISLILLYPFSDSYNQAFESLLKGSFRKSLLEAYQKNYF